MADEDRNLERRFAKHVAPLQDAEAVPRHAELLGQAGLKPSIHTTRVFNESAKRPTSCPVDQQVGADLSQHALMPELHTDRAVPKVGNARVDIEHHKGVVLALFADREPSPRP